VNGKAISNLSTVDGFSKSLKSQISSTKLQMVRQAHHPEPSRRVNLNIQYPMTKTFTTVVSHRSKRYKNMRSIQQLIRGLSINQSLPEIKGQFKNLNMPFFRAD